MTVRADSAEDGWAVVPGQEFADNGGLYAVNRDWFWPKGWALAGRKWDLGATTAESLRAALVKVLERDFNVPLSDSDVDLLIEGLATEMNGVVFDGFYITATVPPETVGTARTRTGEVEIAAKAHDYIEARLAAIAEADRG